VNTPEGVFVKDLRILGNRNLKDVILVKPKDTVRFITKFTTFSDNMIPYMYHCHLLHHEDEGMMGTFLVVDTTLSGIKEVSSNELTVFPNPASSIIHLQFASSSTIDVSLSIMDLMGKIVLSRMAKVLNGEMDVDILNLASGMYFITIENKDNFYSSKISKQ
jgi:bilirubin oxidase